MYTGVVRGFIETVIAMEYEKEIWIEYSKVRGFIEIVIAMEIQKEYA